MSQRLHQRCLMFMIYVYTTVCVIYVYTTVCVICVYTVSFKLYQFKSLTRHCRDMKYNNWQSVCKFWLCVTFGWKHGSWVVNVLANWMHIRPLLCRQDRHSGNLQTTWLSQCSIQRCQVSYFGIEIFVFTNFSRL